MKRFFYDFQLLFHHKSVFTLENTKSDLQTTWSIKKYQEMTEGDSDVAKLHEK